MDFHVQELCLCDTVSDRGWRHRKPYSCQGEPRLLSLLTALSLLHGMAIQTCHDLANVALVWNWW